MNLEPNAKIPRIEGKIIEIQEPRTVMGTKKVADAILEVGDERIQMALWDKEITQFKPGDTIVITNGYVAQFKGQPQITAGKYGKIMLK